MVAARALLMSALVLPLVFTAAVSAAEIRLLHNPGSRAILPEIISQFERSTGHSIITTMAVSQGLKRHIDAGTPFDAVILTPPSILDGVISQGKVHSDSRTNIARVGLTFIARSTAMRRDISTVNAFKSTVLDARSIVYLDESAPARYFLGLIERLEITQAVRPKLKAARTPDILGKGIASGEFDLGLVPLSTPVLPGVVKLGPFPAEIQSYEEIVGGVSTNAANPDAAGAFLRVFSTPQALAVIREKGMEAPRLP
jgi:molybdate transport system substrate-binding protein